VECAVVLHDLAKGRLDELERVVITTQESAIRIISKSGPLHNPADRDHCLQYMVAIGLIFGELTADHYSDSVAHDPRIDRLRKKMQVVEDTQYSYDYHHPDKRSIANAVELFFKGGGSSGKVAVEFPLGHRRRRAEGIPLLIQKCQSNLGERLPPAQVEKVMALCLDRQRLEKMSVEEFMGMFVI
jgi:2-methylcitrate dehydratase